MDTGIDWQHIRERYCAFMRRRVSDDELAEELAQETMLRVHRALIRGVQPHDPQAWIATIARHVLYDYYRKSARSEEKNFEVDVLERVAVQDVEGGADDEGDAFGVGEMIDGLKPIYRDALRLVEIEGLKQTDAASELGVPLATLKARVQRGRRKLCEVIAECCNVQFDSRGAVQNLIPWEEEEEQ